MFASTHSNRALAADSFWAEDVAFVRGRTQDQLRGSVQDKPNAVLSPFLSPF